jgi:hypothetical protein
MPPTGFEPAIPASEGPQTHALARADIGIRFSAFSIIKVSRIDLIMATFSKNVQSDFYAGWLRQLDI